MSKAFLKIQAFSTSCKPQQCESNQMFPFPLKKSSHSGVPVVAQWLTNPTRNHEVAGSVPALAQWVNDPALP